MKFSATIEAINGLISDYLKFLDPSLFQYIAVAFLAIFIPFAIVFLSDFNNNKKIPKNGFNKLVLNDEVLKSKKIFIVSLASVIFFSFVAGKEVLYELKLLSIFFSFLLVLFYWNTFKKIVLISEENTLELELEYLKKLNPKKYITEHSNQYKNIKKSWQSIWSNDNLFNEKEFLEIFISHIDSAMKLRKYQLATEIFKYYIDNIEHRIPYLLTKLLFPKTLEWDELLDKGIDEYRSEKKSKKKIFGNLFKKSYPSENSEFFFTHPRFCDKKYFEKIISRNIKTNKNQYSCTDLLFEEFDSYIKNFNNQNSKLTDKDKRENNSAYIQNVCINFFTATFDAFPSESQQVQIREPRESFLKEWKITSENKNYLSGAVLKSFLEWSRDHFNMSKKIDKFCLSNLMECIFPTVDYQLFNAFLYIYYSGGFEEIIEKPIYFSTENTINSYSFPISMSEKERQLEIEKQRVAERKKVVEETIDVIYYNKFNLVNLFIRDDLSKQQIEGWENFDEEKKKSIFKNLLIKNLNNLLTKIRNTGKNENYYSDNYIYDNKDTFIELIDSLIVKVRVSYL